VAPTILAEARTTAGTPAAYRSAHSPAAAARYGWPASAPSCRSGSPLEGWSFRSA
jgi:hypothetical protein